MAVTEKIVDAARDQDLFLGTHGIHPNHVITITPGQAACLQGELEGTPAPALQRAFEIRKQNQAKSKTAR